MADVVANGVRHHVQRLGTRRAHRRVRPRPRDGQPVELLLHAREPGRRSVAEVDPLRPARPRHVGAPGDRLLASPTLVADLAALLDALAITRPVTLVGNSFGGLLALAFAAAHPERVARLALIDAHDGTDGWAAQMTVDARAQRRRARREDRRDRSRAGSAATASASAPGSPQPPRRSSSGTSLVADLRASPRDLAALARSRCPTLALYGETLRRPRARRGARARRCRRARCSCCPAARTRCCGRRPPRSRARVIAFVRGAA